MSDLMGKQHETEPVTKADKEMSKRHKKHRKEIDDMKDGPEKFAKSRVYNKSHMLEHKKAMKTAEKQMKKMGKYR
jgi:hypothetical protein